MCDALKKEVSLKPLTFYIEEDQLEKLKRLSEETHISRSTLIRMAIDKFLKNEGEKLRAISVGS